MTLVVNLSGSAVQGSYITATLSGLPTISNLVSFKIKFEWLSDGQVIVPNSGSGSSGTGNEGSFAGGGGAGAFDGNMALYYQRLYRELPERAHMYLLGQDQVGSAISVRVTLTAVTSTGTVEYNGASFTTSLIQDVNDPASGILDIKGHAIGVIAIQQQN